MAAPSSYNPYNIGEILEETLLRHLKDVITDRITKKLMKELEKDVRKIIEAETEKLVIGQAEHIRNLMEMKEELQVYFTWEEK